MEGPSTFTAIKEKKERRCLTRGPHHRDVHRQQVAASDVLHLVLHPQQRQAVAHAQVELRQPNLLQE